MPRKSASPLKPIPAFKSEADERAFWKTHDAMDYLGLSKAQRVTLPLEGIKNAANKRDVPYQSLIKVWLQEKLEEA